MISIKTRSGKEVYKGDWVKGLFDRCYAYVKRTQAPLIVYLPSGTEFLTMDVDSTYFEKEKESPIESMAKTEAAP